MNIEILDFEMHPCKTKLAYVLVQYEKMVFRCEIVYHIGSRKAWVMMPEIWKTKTKELKYAWWCTKEDSDEFQKVVLNKIFDKYDLDTDKLALLHADRENKSGNSRNV